MTHNKQHVPRHPHTHSFQALSHSYYTSLPTSTSLHGRFSVIHKSKSAQYLLLCVEVKWLHHRRKVLFVCCFLSTFLIDQGSLRSTDVGWTVRGTLLSGRQDLESALPSSAREITQLDEANEQLPLATPDEGAVVESNDEEEEELLKTISRGSRLDGATSATSRGSGTVQSGLQSDVFRTGASTAGT